MKTSNYEQISIADTKKRNAVAFRLDERRHFVLKMISHRLKISGEEILVTALDEYFKRTVQNEMPNCLCLNELVSESESSADHEKQD